MARIIQNNWRLYKSKSGVEFSFAERTKEKKDNEIVEKVIYLSAANKDGADHPNWNNAIRIMLSTKDVVDMLYAVKKAKFPKDKALVTHDPGAGNSSTKGQEFKYLNFMKADMGDFFLLNVGSKKGEEKKNVSIAFTPPELYALGVFLEAALPLMQGISYDHNRSERVN